MMNAIVLNENDKNVKSYNNVYIENLIDSILNADLSTWEHFAKGGNELQLPFNANSGTGYKGLNSLKLMFQSVNNGFTSPYFVTIGIAKKIKANFKGSKSTRIYKFGYKYEHKETNATISEDKYNGLNNIDKENYKKSVFNKPYFVLNFDQFHNLDEIDQSSLKIEAPKFERDFELNQDAEVFFNSLEVYKGLNLMRKRTKKAFYNPSKDFVEIPLDGIFIDDTAYYSTTFHELIHWTGHESRLNRFDKSFINSNDDKENYAFEELVAEIGALLLCAEFNIYKGFKNSCAYLYGWLKATNQDDREKILRMAFTEANKAKKFLLKLN